MFQQFMLFLSGFQLPRKYNFSKAPLIKEREGCGSIYMAHVGAS